MDISGTIEPNSEQINAEDLLAGPRTVTVTGVEKGTTEQPVFVHLAEFPGRTFRPAKSVRRIIVAAWGAEASAYTGRRLTIYNDHTVRWAGQEIGGVRISHMSDLSEPLTVLLSVSRGKRQAVTIQPLEPPKDTSGRDWLKELTQTEGDADLIAALGAAARKANANATVLDVIRDAYHEAKKGK
jgi:hypothetical protein